MCAEFKAELLSVPTADFITLTGRMGNLLDINIMRVDVIESLPDGTRIHIGNTFFDVREDRDTVIELVKGDSG